MIIYINGRFLTQSITGVQRYAIELVKELDQILSEQNVEHEYIILTPKNAVNIGLNKITQKTVGNLKGQFWEQLELPFYSKGCLLINFCNLSPLFKRNQIITIHDCAVFEEFNNLSTLFKLWYQVNYKVFKKRFKKVITVSKFSEKRIQEFNIVTQDKIRVIYEGKEHLEAIEEQPDSLKKYDIESMPFILAVSSMNPTKNFKGIVQALAYLDSTSFNVVIAGGTNPKVFGSSELKFPENVKHIGYVSDAELKQLYKKATGFIYPSLYEGFGLPPLEAMSMGCPVIVSDAASLPEVCEEAALYCNPMDASDIADKILRLTEDSCLREELSIRGIAQSKKFSWREAAFETKKIIESSL
ncbi:glycosyltransferase family 4 protein [Alkalicoccobacillus porphyridii]|uniref:Glycosyltransferase family 4 protein n=1 Tax=Alkalicoccobacillus porphyridii TaxID=2597270 RepID=A0A554A4B6_9BACI|nr:glycosyltransferase family 1 protein [Alkalicoccobacillus porphyridii]TSB48534.1 glycosyltransferase family 4 protein [Alkalicoccobacillus porphyridii]